MSIPIEPEPTSADALQQNFTPLADKFRRLAWNIAWTLIFRPTPTVAHEWRSMVLRMFGAKIGKANHIYPSAKVWAPWLLETEHVVTLGPGSEVYNPGGVKLGHHTIVSQGAYLCGATHNYNSPNFTYVPRPISTGKYAWICARAVVLPGVDIGDGAVLGAASVATRSLAPWSVNAGNPAKAVGFRSPEIATHD